MTCALDVTECVPEDANMRFSARRMSEGLLVVSIGAVVVAAVNAGDALSSSTLRLEAMSVSADRLRAMDMLVGADASVGLGWIDSRVGGPDAPQETLLWIVDSDRCVGCLRKPADWLRARSIPGIRAWLVVSGTGQAKADSLARSVGITGGVLADPERIFSRTYGTILPDTRLLVSSSGFVLMADSRYPTQSCAWSFFNQVAALKGLGDEGAIRKAQPPGASLFSQDDELDSSG